MEPRFERLRRALTPDYELQRELGQGGMGIVYLAREVALNRLVAIKVLRPELATARAMERFRREAQTLAQLRHPNIVAVYDWGDYDGPPYLVTEHLGKAKVDFKNCTAYLCGPHAMIQAAMRDLSLMGMPDDRIITTLEAHMKCGVGKCGHCYCGGKLICEEGPIFSLEEIKKFNILPGVDSLG